MNTYEFITPSDPITFKAENDKVAFICALQLGNGKAGCRNSDTDETLPSMLIFSQDPEKEIRDFLDDDAPGFIDANMDEIAACFSSFAYGSVSERKTFDDAIQAITDPDKLKEFKRKHEEKNRTSMSQWVMQAWKYGNQLTK